MYRMRYHLSWLFSFFLVLAISCTGAKDKNNNDGKTPGDPDKDKDQTGVVITDKTVGSTSFFSALPGGSNFGNQNTRNMAGAADDTAAEKSDGTANEDRKVEEADLYRVDGNTLFVLNEFRGLHAIDVTNPDAPKVLSRAPIFGFPIDMYIRPTEKLAFVLVSNYFSYWSFESTKIASSDVVAPFSGSQVVVVDISDLNKIEILDTINLEGAITDSRIVGDILYVVKSRQSWWYYDFSQDTEDNASVVSIDVSHPEKPSIIEELSFPGNASEIHVTQNALFVTQNFYEQGQTSSDQTRAESNKGDTGVSDETEPSSGDENPVSQPAEPDVWVSDQEKTKIQYIDISDPDGKLKKRGSITVSGYPQGRFHMDAFENYFRIVTQKWEQGSNSILNIIDTTNPDTLTLTSSIGDIGKGEQLHATRFDGERAYVVTFEQIDPLWIIDLSDPKNPEIAGELEVPGWSDFIEPRGNSLIAVGHEQVNDEFKVTVSLFDVTNITQPKQRDREHIGEGWSYSEANNEIKAFKILEDRGANLADLILVPYSSWNWNKTDQSEIYKNGLQLIELNLEAVADKDSLVKRGKIEQQGYVERAFAIKDRLASVSTEELLVINADDLDNLAISAKLTLTRNVYDVAVLKSSIIQAVLPSSYWGYNNTTSLVAVSKDKADSVNETLGSIEIEGTSHLYFPKEDSLLIVSNRYKANPAYSRVWTNDYETIVTTIDFSNPAQPKKLDELVLDIYVNTYSESYSSLNRYAYQNGGGEIVQVSDTALAFHPYRDFWMYEECNKIDGSQSNGGQSTPSNPGSVEPTSDQGDTSSGSGGDSSSDTTHDDTEDADNGSEDTDSSSDAGEPDEANKEEPVDNETPVEKESSYDPYAYCNDPQPKNQVIVIDTSNASDLKEAKTIDLADDITFNFFAHDNILFFNHIKVIQEGDLNQSDGVATNTVEADASSGSSEGSAPAPKSGGSQKSALTAEEKKAAVPVVQYFADRLDVSNLADIKLLTPINIPGVLISVDDTTFYSVDMQYEWGSENEWDLKVKFSLNLLTIANDLATLKSFIDLGYNAGQIAIADKVAIVTQEPYQMYYMTGAVAETSVETVGVKRSGLEGDVKAEEYQGPQFSIKVLDLSDIETPVQKSEIKLAGYGWVLAKHQKKVLINAGGQALLVYKLDDLSAPTLDNFVRTNGWIYKVIIDDQNNTALLPSGLYGVYQLSL